MGNKTINKFFEDEMNDEELVNVTTLEYNDTLLEKMLEII